MSFYLFFNIFNVLEIPFKKYILNMHSVRHYEYMQPTPQEAKHEHFRKCQCECTNL